MRARGIDLSGWQTINDPLSWLAAARSCGISFVGIKSSQGNSSRSKVYAARQEACRALNLRSGPYHFANPDALARDPQLEATLCHEVAGPWQPGDLPPTLDFEDDAAHPIILPPAVLVQWGLTFLEEIGRLAELPVDLAPILYTGPGFWGQKLTRTTAFARFPLWQAEYHNESRPKDPEVAGDKPSHMAPWPAWKIWQWTGKGQLPFHNGDLDLNVYNGTVDDLDQWCKVA